VSEGRLLREAKVVTRSNKKNEIGGDLATGTPVEWAGGASLFERGEVRGGSGGSYVGATKFLEAISRKTAAPGGYLRPGTCNASNYSRTERTVSGAGRSSSGFNGIVDDRILADEHQAGRRGWEFSGNFPLAMERRFCPLRHTRSGKPPENGRFWADFSTELGWRTRNFDCLSMENKFRFEDPLTAQIPRWPVGYNQWGALVRHFLGGTLKKYWRD